MYGCVVVVVVVLWGFLVRGALAWSGLWADERLLEGEIAPLLFYYSLGGGGRQGLGSRLFAFGGA